MRVVRKGVFETNSSSTHSITIENSYIDESVCFPSIPYNKGKDVKYLDILKLELEQSGLSMGSLSKLRIIVSLITEYIYYEYHEKKKIDYMKAKGLDVYKWSYDFNDYILKAEETSAAKNYVLNHRFWGYLNTLLKQNYGVNIKIYETCRCFPYICEFVDDGEGSESSHYYKVLGLNPHIDAVKFKKLIGDILLNDALGFYQECWRDN